MSTFMPRLSSFRRDAFRLVRALMLAGMLWAAPACATLTPDGAPSVSASIDRQAYAVLQTYAALLEEATLIAQDPRTPPGVKRAMAAAEAVATPSVTALKAAADAHRLAEGDDAALSEALRAAQGPVSALRAAMPSR